jgi:hypothetical protein
MTLLSQITANFCRVAASPTNHVFKKVVNELEKLADNVLLIAHCHGSWALNFDFLT